MTIPRLSEATRAYIYRVALALFAAGVVYGIIEKDDVEIWLPILMAVLGIGSSGLAARNTSTDPNRPKTLRGANYSGNIIVVNKDDGTKLYSLELDIDPDKLSEKDEVTFRVVPEPNAIIEL